VPKELRDMCIFSSHSIIRDPPFSRLDLISCRNLLIYLKPTLQSQIIPLFHYSLRPGGYLFLGSSENLSRHTELFLSPDKKKPRLPAPRFRRAPAAAAAAIHAAVPARGGRPGRWSEHVVAALRRASDPC
jgi:two-component system CheB/CheR fusion protein